MQKLKQSVRAAGFGITIALLLSACGGGGSGDSAVPVTAIAANPDSFSLAGGSSANVLLNDLLGTAPASALSVTVSTTTAVQAGITISPSGQVSVGNEVPSGTYSFGYQICQTASPLNCGSAVATITVPVTATVTGRALNAATGGGIAGVTVTAGGRTTTTDISGNFSVRNLVPGSNLTVLFRSDLYAESARNTTVPAAGVTDVQVRLLAVRANVLVSAATGGTVALANSSAQVVLPADGFTRADGSIPTGNIRVSLTPINPAADSAVMPGDYTTVVAGVTRSIESFGALNVQLSDSGGALLNLRLGKTAVIRIPLASRSPTAPATIPLFYFDTQTGRWVEEGTATLGGFGAARYYEGVVKHFSTWNADRIYDTVLVTGCVQTAAAARLGGVSLMTDGVDYTGTSSAVTDSSGNFTIAMRRGSQATLVGLSDGKLTNTLRVGPFLSNSTLSQCLALGQTGAGVTMKLTWGQLPRDLDSHLYAPSGAEIFFGNKGSLLSAPNANLDVDDIDSYGPEVVTITRLMVGTYKFTIHNYSGFSSGSISNSGATVELNVPGRSFELFIPSGTETSTTNWWNVFEFDVSPSCQITVRRVNTFSTVEPTALTAPPVYCTAAP